MILHLPVMKTALLLVTLVVFSAYGQDGNSQSGHLPPPMSGDQVDSITREREGSGPGLLPPPMTDVKDDTITIGQDENAGSDPVPHPLYDDELDGIGERDGPEYTEEEIRDRIRTYTKLRNGGIGVICGGVAMTILGIALLVNREDIDEDKPGRVEVNAADFGAMMRLAVFAEGIFFCAGGAVITSIGGKKINEYRKRLDDISVRFGAGRGYMVLRLMYEF